MKKRVLIFPAGSEIGLEINNALKYSTHFEIYGLTSVPNHCDYVYKKCITGCSYYNSPEFIDELNQIINDNHIDYIYPAYDDVQLFLMENENRVNATIISADLFTARICRSKSETYEFFKNEKFIPKTYSDKSAVVKFPVFLKPDVGQGSQGAVLVNNEYELDYAISENPSRIICEYLPGEEYTVDCFTDAERKIVCMKMRNRKRIRTGISVCSELLEMNDAVKTIAETINERLNFKGAWFFQIKKNEAGEYKLLEVAPRIAGTMGLTRNTGTNYPLMTLFMYEGLEVKAINNNYGIVVDRAFISRYKTDIEYDSVYVDFDDTIRIDGKVNKYLIMFLYQAINEGKKIYLLSRHRDDIHLSLKKCCISEELFEKIIIISEKEKKSAYINSRQAIYIDDSFAERLDVSQNCSVPVFDCSEVEALIDWRM